MLKHVSSNSTQVDLGELLSHHFQVKSENPGFINQFSTVQSLSHVRLFATPWIAACQASLSITNSWSSLKLMSIKLVMPPSHLILCRPLPLLLPIPPSIRVFSNESTLLMRWPKYWSFSFSIIPSKEHPGLIFFRMDWLDLLAVQGTLKTLLQHHSSKASILRCLAFFTVQLSYPYMTTSTNTRKWAPFNWWVGAGHHFLPGLSPGSKEQGLLVIAHHKVLTDTVEGRGGLVNTEGTIWIFHSHQAFPHTTSVGRMKGWRSSHYYWVEMVIYNPHRVSTDDGGQGLIFEWMQKLWFSRRPPLGLLL